ncbi:hypothetical protein GG344DRAFT_83320 [Lentinula edodes]|nr:hypothetical protein GG344DRAFT_83320 [Lentinula edodes]
MAPLELNMLNKQDSKDVDNYELQHFLHAQEEEATIAARQKHACASPLPEVPLKKKWLTWVSKLVPFPSAASSSNPLPVSSPPPLILAHAEEQQQSLVNESNALAVCQKKKIEALQEEVHQFWARNLFVGKMGKLNNTLAALQWVATSTHHLYRSNPATVLHQHNYVDFTNISFQLTLDFPEATRNVHTEWFLCFLSSVQWFFHTAAERKEGTYCLVLTYSCFPDNAPFVNVTQHARFVLPFNDSPRTAPPPWYVSLEMALPYHDFGNWEDMNQATHNWEAMIGPRGADSPSLAALLFLPDPTSPASLLLPDFSQPPPPVFGTVAALAIDLTSEDGDEDIYESTVSQDHHLEWEMEELWDLDLGNVEATPYVKLRAASPLQPPTLKDIHL